jgi:hypothetical protein
MNVISQEAAITAAPTQRDRLAYFGLAKQHARTKNE